jgi:hypothetical protein
MVDHGSARRVDADHRGIGFAANEHHLSRGVERLAMRVIAPRSRNPVGDG